MVRRPMFSFHVRLGAWRLGKTSFLRPKSNDNVFVVPFISSPQGKVTLDYPIRLCVWELVDATTQRTCPLPSHKVIAKKRCMDKQKSRGFHRSICTNGGGRIQFPPRISQMLVKQTSLSKGYIFAWLVLNIALQWTKDALRSAEHQGSENSVVSNWRGNKEFLASGNVLFATRLSKASASGFRRKYFSGPRSWRFVQCEAWSSQLWTWKSATTNRRNRTSCWCAIFWLGRLRKGLSSTLEISWTSHGVRFPGFQVL